MTQKNYIAFASMIKSELDELIQAQGSVERGSVIDHKLTAKRMQTEIIANRMANIFANDNPRFKRGTFLRACGLEQS